MWFKLTDNQKEYNGHIVYQIVYTKDLFAQFKNGFLGGWVEFEHNLSQSFPFGFSEDSIIIGNDSVVKISGKLLSSIVADSFVSSENSYAKIVSSKIESTTINIKNNKKVFNKCDVGCNSFLSFLLEDSKIICSDISCSHSCVNIRRSKIKNQKIECSGNEYLTDKSDCFFSVADSKILSVLDNENSCSLISANKSQVSISDSDLFSSPNNRNVIRAANDSKISMFSTNIEQSHSLLILADQNGSISLSKNNINANFDIMVQHFREVNIIGSTIRNDNGEEIEISSGLTSFGSSSTTVRDSLLTNNAHIVVSKDKDYLIYKTKVMSNGFVINSSTKNCLIDGDSVIKDLLIYDSVIDLHDDETAIGQSLVGFKNNCSKIKLKNLQITSKNDFCIINNVFNPNEFALVFRTKENSVNIAVVFGDEDNIKYFESIKTCSDFLNFVINDASVFFESFSSKNFKMKKIIFKNIEKSISTSASVLNDSIFTKEQLEFILIFFWYFLEKKIKEENLFFPREIMSAFININKFNIFKGIPTTNNMPKVIPNYLNKFVAAQNKNDVIFI